MKHLLPILLLAFAPFLRGHTQSFHFASHSTSTDQLGTATGVDVVTDALGYSYVVGDYDNTVNFDAIEIGGTFGTMYVAKYDPEGNAKWVRNINGSSNNHMRAVDIDVSGNLYVTGEYEHTNSFTELDFGTFSVQGNGSESTFIAKIDTAGDWQWVNTMLSTGPSAVNGKYVRPTDLVWTTEGPVITGEVEEQITVDNQTYNNTNETTFYFAKFEDDGDLIWYKQGTGVVNDLRLAMGSNSSIYFVGNTVSYPPTFDEDSVDVQGSGDVLFGAINGTGALQWWESFGHMSYNEYSPDISLDAASNIYLTSPNPYALQIGDTSVVRIGDANWHLLKFNGTGDFQWMKPLSSNQTGYTYNVLTSGQGTTYVTGFIEAPEFFWPAVFWGDSIGALGSKEAYFTAYGPDGSYLDASGFVFTDVVGPSVVREFLPGEMRFNNEGHIMMTGSWRGSIDIGTETLVNAAWPNQTHMFLLNIDPNELFDLSAGTGDAMIMDNNFNLYPNPTESNITISMKQFANQMEYRILNALGQQMDQGTLKNSNTTLSVDHLAPGVYFMHLHGSKTSTTLRFVIS